MKGAVSEGCEALDTSDVLRIVFHTSLRSRQNCNSFVRPPSKQSPAAASYFPNDEGIQPALARLIGEFPSYRRNPEPATLLSIACFRDCGAAAPGDRRLCSIAPYGGAA